MSDEKYMNAVDSATVVFNEAGAPGISLLDLFPPRAFGLFNHDERFYVEELYYYHLTE